MSEATAGDDRFGSHYLLGEQIGVGAFGVVRLAEHDGNDGLVAVKLLRPELLDDPDSLARFVRERRLFRAVDHPNVVEVLDFVVEGDRCGIVMEYVAGGDLERLQAAERPEQSVGCQLIADVARGLAAIHDQGIVHGDLKPGNVLLDRTPTGISPKIADFGLSQLLADSMARTSSAFGTPLYAAPEVVDGQAATQAGDVYALGVMLFELLAGHPPFQAPSVLSLLHQHATAPIPPLEGVPSELATLVEQMLSKNPADRPTAAQAATALDRTGSPQAEDTERIESETPSLTTAGASEQPAVEDWADVDDWAAVPSTSPSLESLEAERQQGRGLLIGAVALVATLVVVGGFLSARLIGSEDDPQEAVATDNTTPRAPTTTPAPSTEVDPTSSSSNASAVTTTTSLGTEEPTTSAESARPPSSTRATPETTATTSPATTPTTLTTQPTTESTVPTTATQLPTTEPAGLGRLSIAGPSSVECWSPHRLYTVEATGPEPMTSFNWNTSVGLQTPFNAGPEAVLSFDTDPGSYPIQVTVNGSKTASKTITVTEGPGCGAEDLPSPVIDGPGTVACGDTIRYGLINRGTGEVTSAAWQSTTIGISSASTSGATLTFSVAGRNTVSLTVNGSVNTERTITVGDC